MERHLAAILAADVVGYSRLMERDESGAFERLRAHRRELFEPEIEKHHGRIFKLMGDGMLAEFGSVVDAVECAVMLQRGMAERNNGVPDDRRIDVRIGINLGDVIVDGDDRHGDGVNIAARLQHLADAGGICVSGKVAKEVERKLPFTFQPMGEQQVKNIDEPVAVYRVLPDGIARPRQATKRRSRFPLSRALGVTIALLLLIVAGGVAAWKLYPSAPPGGPPSIAVLPFVNMSGDSSDNYLGEGLAEDVITELSTFPTLQVVSRTSSFVYDKPVKVQQVAADLGVSYVLEGSVRKAGGKIRITAQLIDARTGDHVWADRYDEESDNVVTLQGNVASKIYASLGGLRGEITKSEEAVAWQKAAPDLEEYDYYLRGHALLYRETKEDIIRARQIWEEGLKRFPDSALLRVKICFAYEIFISRGWSDDVAADIDTAWKLATEAQAMENKSKLATWLGHWVMAFMYQLHDGDFERSVAEAEAAVRIVPYEARMRSDLSNYLANAGRTQEAVEWAEMAIRVDPNGPPWFHWNLAWAYYLANRPQEALSELEKVGADSSTTLAAVYVRLGQIDKARAMMADFVKQEPDWTLRNEALWPTGKRAGLKEPLASAYLDDLRKAGMPE